MKALDNGKKECIYLDAEARGLLELQSQKTGTPKSALIRRLIVSAYGNKKAAAGGTASGKDTNTALRG